MAPEAGLLPLLSGSDSLPGGPPPSATTVPGDAGTGSGASASALLSGADSSSCSDIHCIQHVIVVVLENQSYDRMFGVFTNTNGMTSSAGIPMVNGAPAPYTCLADPRQVTISGIGLPTPTPWPCQAPYSVPVVPGGTPTPTPGFVYGAEDQYDNPHSYWDSITDTTGISPSLYYRPGTVPTPMTGFLRSAWAECMLPGSATYYYNTHNPACAGGSYVAGSPTPAPFDAMRYLTAAEIPVYWAYAQYYTLEDHLFAPLPSYSLPSHLYLVSNWSAACPISGVASTCATDAATPQALIDYQLANAANQRWPQYAWTDFTYLLDHHQAYVDGAGQPIPTTTPGAFCGTDALGQPNTYINAQGTPIPTTTPGTCTAAPIGWKYYVGQGTLPDCPNPTPVQDGSGGALCSPPGQPNSGTVEYWNPLPFFSTVNADGTPGPGIPTPIPGFPGQTSYVQRYTQFYSDTVNGQLPAVSWLMPDLNYSDHPPYGLTYATWPNDGQALLGWVVKTLSTLDPTQWQHTALFVAWDDWGGFYDHIVPPTPVPTQAPSSMPDPGYGIRVPGLIISPYANHCYIDSRPMSFEAISRFIEDDFLNGQRLDPATDGRGDPRPNVREAGPLAPDLSQDFNWSRTTFGTDGEGVGPGTPTPTPLPYGDIYPTPSADWCSQ